jgi:hypothetical protein
VAQMVREQWQRTVNAVAEEQTDVEASAMLETQVSLQAELGDIALQEMRALLSEGYGGWQPDGDAFTLTLSNGVLLRYYPATGQLQVIARLHETVAAAANASIEASGVARGEVEAEGRGTYYEDAPDAGDEKEARSRARKEAERNLDAAKQQFIESQQRAALKNAQRQAEKQAQTEAQQALQLEAERRKAMLEEQLTALLHDSEEQVQASIGSLLGQTYRRALVRMVNENGGHIVQNEQQGAVIELVARI